MEELRYGYTINYEERESTVKKRDREIVDFTVLSIVLAWLAISAIYLSRVNGKSFAYAYKKYVIKNGHDYLTNYRDNNLYLTIWQRCTPIYIDTLRLSILCCFCCCYFHIDYHRLIK